MPPLPPRGPNKCKAVPHLDLQLGSSTTSRRLIKADFSLSPYSWILLEKSKALTNREPVLLDFKYILYICSTVNIYSIYFIVLRLYSNTPDYRSLS